MLCCHTSDRVGGAALGRRGARGIVHTRGRTWRTDKISDAPLHSTGKVEDNKPSKSNTTGELSCF
jgi:hypothetical protein